MGTSKSIQPGSGGAWTGLKSNITGHFTGSRNVTPGGIVGDTVNATGGIGVGIRRASGGGRSTGGGVGGAVGPVIGGLGGFGTAVRDEGLSSGLESLGLSYLEGKSAIEVVASVADHLTEAVEGIDGELMRNALREAIIDAAALGDGDGYSDLEAGLQTFLIREGVDALVEIFLCKFVFDAVWVNIEAHVQAKAPDQNSLDAFMSAVEGICDSEVRGALDDAREHGDFASRDWFGADGQKLGKEIFSAIDSRLKTMGEL